MKRFWNKVERHGTGCWEWTAAKTVEGYGKFHITGKRVMERAHRVSWKLSNGPIPDGRWVLHTCDNPSCVNPDHLFLGDHQANMDDRKQKGRYSNKLTPNLVSEIRDYLSQGCKQADIADFMGIHNATVSRVATGKAWAHV